MHANLDDDAEAEATSSARRETCARCTRPPRVCYCASLPSALLATADTHVLVLQHAHEQRRRAAISSVPVLARVLQDVTVVAVADDCDCGPGVSPELDALLYDGANGAGFEAALVLFPDERAQPLDAALLASITNTSSSTSTANNASSSKKRALLLVLDGTWKEAKKIAHRNREHWQRAAQRWTLHGATFRYVCLDADEASSATSTQPDDVASAQPSGSIYGDLRREPMAGCVSTLEAVAAALAVLEPANYGQRVQTALLHAFRGMVALQEQFQRRGRAAKLDMYGGVSKEAAMAVKRVHEQQAKQQQALTAVTDAQDAQDAAVVVRRAYAFYTTITDFRHRQQFIQQGESVLCTYDEARNRCVALNRERKRGQRLAMLPLDVFLKQQQDAALISTDH